MKIWAIVVVMVTWCGTLQAGPVELRQVSGDAKWLVHLDVDAMRQSTLMENAYLAGTRQWTELESWLAMACDEVGVDPKVDLHAITMFGKKLGKLEGVAIISAKMQPDVMVRRAKSETGYSSRRYGDQEIHSWTDGRETVTGAFDTPSLLIVARTEEEVRHALDVLHGTAPALAERPCPLVGSAPQGSMLVAWTEGLADSPLPFQSAAVKKSEAIGIVVGEKGNEVFASLRLAMQTTDAAQKMVSVLEGLRAAAELQYEGSSGMMDILKRLKLSISEKTVSAELRAPAEDLWTQINRLLATVKGQNP